MKTSKHFFTQSIIAALFIVCLMLISINAQTDGAINTNITATDAESQSVVGTVVTERGGGAAAITEKEWQRFSKYALPINNIAITDLGAQRLGLKRTTESSVMLYSESAALPVKVDNSKRIYFPPIRAQGILNSCVPFSVCYYQLGYYYSIRKGWNQTGSNKSNNSIKFSPKWVYNFVNNGWNNYTSHLASYETLVKHGCARWQDFPYDGQYNEQNFRQWSNDPAVWRDALNYRIEPYVPYVSQGEHTPDQFISKLKQLLANGEILIIRTWIGSWQSKTIGDDEHTSDDDSERDKQCCYFSSGNETAHSITIVGYNDAIWVDINGNGNIDSGEQGAFRIANSYGDTYWDNGFQWVCYDAIKVQSDVAGWSGGNNRTQAMDGPAFGMILKENSEPRLLVETTLRHAVRNEMHFGTTYQDCPDGWGWEPHLWGGNFPLDGFNPDRSFSMVFDVSSLIEEYLVDDSEEKRWIIHLHDDFIGNPLHVESLKLIDVQGNNEEPVWVHTNEIENGHENYDLYYRLQYGNTNYAPMVNAGPDQVLRFNEDQSTLLHGGYRDDNLPNGASVSLSWRCVDGPIDPAINDPSSESTQVTFTQVGRYVFTLTADDTEKQATDYVTVFVSEDVGHTSVFTKLTSKPYRRAMPYTMPENGVINSITMFHEGGNGDFLLALYDDSNGLPDSLMSVSDYTPINDFGGWQTVILNSPKFVPEGTTVWLAWVFEDNPGIRYRNGTRGRAQSSDEWDEGMPFAFGTSSTTSGEYSIFASYVPTAEGTDTDPPTPNPSTWASNPTATGTSSITMTASTASDPSGVEYYFERVGTGSNSGWQASPTYTDNGLQSGTQYTYQVRSRDLSANNNIGAWSSQRSATTDQGSTESIIGYTDVFTSGSSSKANRRALPLTMQEDGTINSITMYHKGGSGNCIYAVYNGTSDPATRIAVTDPTPINSNEGWQKINLNSPVSVASGSTIWLAWVYESNPGTPYGSGTPSTGRAESSQTWSGGMPTSFGAAGKGNYIYSIYASYTPGGSGIDTDPPTPDPLTWATLPTATSPTTITMTATTAIDESGVEYRFKRVGTSFTSNWQSSPTFTDVGLQPDTEYTYQVMARDGATSPNEGKWSDPESERTPPPSTESIIGYTDVFTSGSSSKANRRALPLTMQEDGTINSITMYHKGGSGNCIYAVYNGTSDPATRIAVTDPTPINSNEGWQKINLNSPVSVASGSTIWLAWVYESNPGTPYGSGTPSTGRAESSQTWSGGMPTSFGAAGKGNFIYSIYASYTPGGAGPVDDVEILGSFEDGSSHAVQPGSNRALVLFAHVEYNGADVHATSVTYGGQPMTLIMESNEGSGYRAFTGAYILDEAGIAAASGNNISVNWNVSLSSDRPASFSHVFLENVNQSSLFGMVDENGGTTSTVATNNLSTNDGDMVLVAATCGAGGSYSVNNGFSKGIEVPVASADGVVGYKKANGASEQGSVTHSAVNRQSVIGLVIKKQ